MDLDDLHNADGSIKTWNVTSTYYRADVKDRAERTLEFDVGPKEEESDLVAGLSLAPVNKKDKIAAARFAYMEAWKCEPEWVDLIVDLYDCKNKFNFNARGRFMGGVVRVRHVKPLLVATS